MEETKTCGTCEINQPLARFELQKKKSGNHCRRNMCVDCRYKQQHSNIKRAVKKWSKSEAGRKNARERMARNRRIPKHLIAYRLRCRLGSIFRNQSACKAGTTQNLVGCSWEELERHIESHFTVGMSWENSSKWHIDHTIALSSFDLTDEEEQRKAFHFTNLRPMWAVDNWSKCDRLPDGTRGRDAPHHKRMDGIASGTSLTKLDELPAV